MHGGFLHFYATLFEQGGVVDEHDTVLHDDTHQNQDTHEGHGAQGSACGPQAKQDASEGEGHREHDDERLHEVLELGSHHDVNQDDDKDEQGEQVAEHLLLGLVVTSDFRINLRRDGGVFDDFLAHLHHIAQYLSLADDGSDADHTFTVLALDLGRCQRFNHLAEVAHADGLSVVVVDLDVLNVLHALTELGGVAYADIIFLAVFTVIGAHRAVDAVLDVGGSRGAIQAIESQLFAVEVDLILRCVFVTTHDDLQDATVTEFLCDFVGHSVGGVEVIAVDLDLNGAHAAHAATAFVDVGFLDFGHGVEFGADLVGHLAGLAQTRLAAFGLGA